jgi:iron complex transport system permease protein
VYRKNETLITLLAIFSIFLLSISFLLGPYSLKPGVILKEIQEWLKLNRIVNERQAILFDIRLPRIILAYIVGSSLSVASACYQSCFRNPLVSEYILGVSAGAAFGATVSMLLLGETAPLQPLAFIFSLFAVGLTYLIANVKRDPRPITLILAGIVVNATFTAAAYILRYFSDPEKLQALIIWLMGSLSSVTWSDLLWTAPMLIPANTFIILIGWKLNILALPEEEAKSLGMEVNKFRFVVIVASTIATAMCVSVVGIIGWIGLMVPHLARAIVGNDNKTVIPASALLGGIILLLADDLTRLSSGAEIPVGIITTAIGAPFFAFLLRRVRM